MRLISSDSTGAGAAISDGRKMRALTASKAIKKMAITAKGTMY